MDKRDFERMVAGFSRGELVDLAWEMRCASGEAERALIGFCEGLVQPGEREALHDRELEMIWADARVIVAEAGEYGWCSEGDEDDANYAFGRMLDLVGRHPTSWGCRRKIVDEVLEELRSDSGTFEDGLSELADGLCAEPGERRYLAERLLEREGFYWARSGSVIMREIGDDEAYLAYRLSHLDAEGDYLDLIGFRDGRGEHESAVALAEEAAGKGLLGGDLFAYLFDEYRASGDDGKVWGLYRRAEGLAGGTYPPRWLGRAVELMYGYCVDVGDVERCDDFLVKAVSCCERDRIREWYGRCADEMSAQRFAAEKAALLKVVEERDPTAFLDICMDEGDTGTVLERITSWKGASPWGNPDMGHRYSRLLEGVYPREIAAHYWNEAQRLAARGGRGNYRECVGVLARIHALMTGNGMQAEWDERYACFLDEHRRKRLLMGLIAEAGPERP